MNNMDFIVQSGPAKISCTKRGEGPILLLIHGAASDRSNFEKTAEILSKDYTVITYDRRGYSESKLYLEDGTEWDSTIYFKTPEEELDQSKKEWFSPKSQAEDAKAILDYLEADKAIVMGSSAGCIIAMELARLYPEKVEKVIVYEAPLTMIEEDDPRILDWKQRMWDATVAKKFTKAFLVLVKELGGIDPDADETPSHQLTKNTKNFNNFLRWEMEWILTYGIKNRGNLEFSMPGIYGAGSCNLETGLFSQLAENNARELGWPLYRCEGYHSFPQEQPERFAKWMMEMLQK